MAASPKYRLKQVPTDIWSIKERLCLASSVLRSGDQNWVSVSRAIRPFGEANRPPDWFSQKNCAIQYSDLLEKVETPKRKRGDRADVETPGNLIVRKLTIERIEELKRIISEEQQRHRKLKQEVEAVKSGCVDDRLEDVWNKIQEEIKLKAAAEASYQKWLQEREAKINAMKATPKPVGKSKKLFPRQPRVEEVRRNSSQSEQSEQESIIDSPLSEPLNADYFVQVDDVSSPQSTISHTDGISSTISTKVSVPSITICTSTHGSQTPSTSPLLTSLLKSPTPATPISPTITSVLTSPTPQPKEGTLPTTQTSPRPISTPQPFFNPTSALATAAARQLAVATAPSSNTSSVDSLFLKDKAHSANQNINNEGNIPPIVTHSSTSSAPTLSKLLELPPGVPGKLPPLPIIQTEQEVSSTGEIPTVSTVTITTVTTTSSSAITNVVSVTSEEVVESSREKTESDSLISSTEDEKITETKDDICKHKVDIKIEPASPPRNKEEIEENEIENTEVVDKVEELQEIKKEVIHSESIEENEIVVKNEEVGNENLEKEESLLEKVFDENINEDKQKEQPSNNTFTYEKVEENIVNEEQNTTVTTEKETDISSSNHSDPEVVSKVTTEKVIEKVADEAVIQDKKQLPVEEETAESKKDENKDVNTKQQSVETEKTLTEDEKKNKPIEEPAKEAVVIVESDKVIEELKIIRKHSGKRGRKGRGGRTNRHIHVHEDLEDSFGDKKSDKEKTNSSLPHSELTAKQVVNDHQEKANETQHSSCKSDSTNQQSDASTEQTLLETKRKPLLSISESIPNSPASTSQSDDQENIKDYRTWKKAIMLVWNAAANHKYANTFLHPVTDDVAPGYHSIVYRPMDLSAIKKNIENGVIKTTMEFQRDMMLMFQNAVMYNSSDHDVFHMAVEMQKEVMEHIQDFLATQLMVQTADTKVLRGREREPRERKSDGDKDDKRKYPYMTDSEPKAKKRRTRE